MAALSAAVSLTFDLRLDNEQEAVQQCDNFGPNHKFCSIFFNNIAKNTRYTTC